MSTIAAAGGRGPIASVPMTEFIKFADDGHLLIEDLPAAEIAAEFGTPVYVTSERQLRSNYRRLHEAFVARYPRTTILYANKANFNLAVRRVLTDEGAGGDCFGIGELTLSLMSGVPARNLVLNGSNKGPEELRAAIEAGATINVDHPDELETVATLADELHARANVNVRVLPFSYADPSAMPPDLASIASDRSHDKWGMDRTTILSLVPRALALPGINLRGLHFHVSRLRPTAEPFALAVELIVECLAELRDKFRWEPEVLDIGGGFAHERDPESGRPAGDHPVSAPEEYAEAIVAPLRDGLARRQLQEPHLFLEPGRRLVSNAAVLLTRVGIVKRLPSSTVTWINVDASTNHVLRAPLLGYRYEIVHATGGSDRQTVVANVTGPNCTLDLLAEDRVLEETRTGDLLAILDVGGYAEAFGVQFNLIPRPASVLVLRDRVELIRRGETIEDLLATQVVPQRLRA